MGLFDNIFGGNKATSETIQPVKLSAKAKDKQMIRITEWSNERSRKDINSWMAALATAENVIMPRRWDLIKLYDSLELDSHSIMLRNRFRRHLTGRAFVLKDKKTGKTDEEATKLIQKRWFYDLLKYKSDSKFFGHSLVQIKELKDGEISSVELVKRKFIVPELGGYMPTQGANVVNYRDDPALMQWLFEADNGDFGYFNPAAPHIMFKKNAMIAWSEYCEIFGLPIRYVETDNTTTKDIERLKKALINMGKSAYGIFQTGESLKFAETQRADAYNVFNMLKEACNMEMSKMILGETMTSDVGANGGNRALGEVHQGTSNETAEENRTDAVTWANEVVMPNLIVHGYGFQNLEYDYPTLAVFNDTEWKVLQGLLAEFDIDAKYFIDKYGVPITGKKNKDVQPLDPNKLQALLNNASSKDYVHSLKLRLAIHSLYEEHCCEEEAIAA